MGTPQLGQFCWNELGTTNVEEAKKFYGTVFGWEFVDHSMGDMNYTMIKLKGSHEFGGIWAIPKEKSKDIPPHWMAYILVENVETSLKKAEENGAHVVHPVTQAGNMGRFAIITDPAGAHIAIWQSLR
ncbi:27 kDa antigen Cfp30B [Candidatus Rubidus massiliensis]|nr:MAG: glyoxalase [Chlamydia sp. 32-24]CDZ80838.1 27 kDa antigen Cfp30B [Candidatus Rubidus massiliensis]